MTTGGGASSCELRHFGLRDELELILSNQSLITQLFSWGRLQITQEAFQQILTSQHVFRPFSKILHEFGAKTRDGLPKSEGIFIQCLEVDKSWEAGVEHGNCIYGELILLVRNIPHWV